jgi:hypothetical protein
MYSVICCGFHDGTPVAGRRDIYLDGNREYLYQTQVWPPDIYAEWVARYFLGDIRHRRVNTRLK